MQLTNNASTYVRVYGRFFKVEHIAKSINEANEYCAKHTDMGVICEDKALGLVYICDLEDMGFAPEDMVHAK